MKMETKLQSPFRKYLWLVQQKTTVQVVMLQETCMTENVIIDEVEEVEDEVVEVHQVPLLQRKQMNHKP
jgi:hypothetical protein